MFHIRPKWITGNKPAVISEKVVMASAKRYIGLRQSAWMMCNIADSKVPE